MEAYPTTVGPIEFTWGSEGEIAQFTVTWAYRDWNHTDPVGGWWADPDKKTEVGQEIVHTGLPVK